jgi:hypothetical protein
MLQLVILLVCSSAVVAATTDIGTTDPELELFQFWPDSD